MDLTLVTGLITIIISYGLTWFFVIKSKNIIENINKKRLKTTREIEKELEL